MRGMERRERQRACEALWRALANRAHRAPTAIPGYQGDRFEARAPNDVGRCASRRSTYGAIVGRRTLLRHRNVTRDDALCEQAG